MILRTAVICSFQRQSALLVAGGIQYNNEPTNSVEIFLTLENRWIMFHNMIEPRSWYPNCAMYYKRLICMGGKVSTYRVRQFDCPSFAAKRRDSYSAAPYKDD